MTAAADMLPDLAAPALYLSVSVTSSLVENWVGTLSEYRFPYPYATTEIHLLLGLATLGLFRLGWCLWPDPGRRRKLEQPPSSEEELPNSRRHTFTHLSVEHAPGPLQENKILYACALAGVCWTAVLVVEVYAREHVDPAFWSSVQLAPLLIALALAWATAGRSVRLTLSAMISAGLLAFGYSSDAVKQVAPRDWLAGLAWSVACLIWVRALRAQTAGGIRRGTGSPGQKDRVYRSTVLIDRVIISLLVASLCCLPLLYTSNEIASIRRFRHFAFFTEAGFWAQELTMAVCGIFHLLTFHYLVSRCDDLTVFSSVALKHELQPEVFHWFLRNPRVFLAVREGPVISNPRYAGVFALAGIALSFRLVQLSRTRSRVT